jgi:hypothetical protein
MATNSWVGATTGTSNLWQTASNWSKGVPTSTNDVAINASGTYTVVIDAAERPYQIKSLQMGGASGSTRLIDNGSLSIIGNANLAHSIFDVGAGGTGSVFGSFTLDASSTALTEGVLNIGSAMINSGGTVDVDGGSLFTGSVSGSGDYTISLDGTIEVGGNVTGANASANVISFSDTGADTLLLDGVGTTLNATIAGFGGDNGIDIGSLPFSTQLTTHYNGTTLTIGSGNVAVFTIAHVNNPGAFALADDGSGGTVLTVCYAQGTMVEAVDGEVAVEALRPGDRVMTLRGSELTPVPVIWIGHRRVNLAAHPHPRMVAPIRIDRSAFADNVPHRDLLVSPDHAILTDGKLICARQLINGATIRQDTDRNSIIYYHVELEKHAIMLAEGLPAESYLDTGNRGFFANSDQPGPLYPDLTDDADNAKREANSCEPFATDERSIRPVWQRLAERAGAIGRRPASPRTTDDPKLRLLAGGRLIKPVTTDAHRYIFMLPRGVSEVRLISQAATPTDARPWLEDRRRLGVRVARLVVRGGDELCDIPLDHPSLVSGWWATERDGMALRRWTDGSAVLPLPAVRGVAILEIAIADTVPYIVAEELALAS